MIQEYDLPPPNEGVSHCGELRFGKSEYLWRNQPHAPESTPYFIRSPKGNWKLRKNWRELLRPADPWALRYIYHDPEKLYVLGRLDPDVGYLPDYELWDPDLFQNMAILHRPLIVELYQAAQSGMTDRSLRGIYTVVLQFFRGEYRVAYQRQWEAEQVQHQVVYAQRYLPVTWDQHWTRACRFFDEAALTVAQFLLRHYTLFEEHWTPLLAEAVDLREHWRHFTDPQFQVEMTFCPKPEPNTLPPPTNTFIV